MTEQAIAAESAPKAKITAYDKAMAALLFMLASVGAWASVDQSDDPFYDFFETVEGWASGGLGVGIAITSVLIGGARAVGNNNPMSALGGVALAAFIHWGPTIIKDLIADGAVFM